MSPEIIIDTVAFLERVQLTGKEVPAFNRVITSLISLRNEMLNETKN